MVFILFSSRKSARVRERRQRHAPGARYVALRRRTSDRGCRERRRACHCITRSRPVLRPAAYSVHSKKDPSPTRLRLCSVGLATCVSGTCLWLRLNPLGSSANCARTAFTSFLSELERERLENFSSPSLPSPARSLWEVKRMGVAAAGRPRLLYSFCVSCSLRTHVDKQTQENQPARGQSAPAGVQSV